MADRPARKARPATKLVVRRVNRVTPRLVRIVAAPRSADELGRFITPHTDAYVKVVFGKPGVRYPEPFDLNRVHAELPREQWPALRTYTVREVRPDEGEIVIDFVYHGNVGLAGPWAASAVPGTELWVLGPGGGYAPDITADWHLLVGDESALPAITAALRRIPTRAPVYAFIEVEDAAERQELSCPGDLRVRWLHRSELGPGAVVPEVRRFAFPNGRVHAFVHGEAGAVKELRRHLLGERGLIPDQLSISGYWRRGLDDESFRAEKAAEAQAELARTG